MEVHKKAPRARPFGARPLGGRLFFFFLWRRVRPPPRRFQRPAQRRALVRNGRRGRLVPAHRRGALARWNQVLLRSDKVAQRERHSRRLVRFRLFQPSRSHVEKWFGRAGTRLASRRCLSRRPRPIPWMVPQLAACGGRNQAQSPVQKRGPPPLDPRRAKPPPVQNAPQPPLSPRDFLALGAGSASPFGSLPP